jgi:hypothetical protein
MQIIRTPDETVEYDAYNPAIRRWFGLKGVDGRLPDLETFLQEDSELSDFCMLADVKLNPLKIKYSKAGAKLESLYGKPIAGKMLDELFNEWFRKRAYEGYKNMVGEKLPVYEQRSLSTIKGKLGYYKLYLPFDDCNRAITYIIPSNPKFRKRLDWEQIVKKTPWL